MRIYDLAKAIGQQFSTDVKSKELADEFKSMPEFASIHDQIKSHSSSVSDEDAAKMFEIYRQRLGKGRSEPPKSGKESVPSSVLKTDVKPQPKPVPPTATIPPRREAPPIPPRPSVTTPPRPQTSSLPPRPQTSAVPPRPQPGLPRPAVPPLGTPHPAPLRPAGPRPIAAPIPAARRATPIAPTAPPPAAPAIPPTPAAPPAVAAPKAMPPQVPAKPAAPEQHAPAAPAKPAQQVHAVAPQAQKPRPSAPAAKLKSSSGTTGYSAAPGALKAESPEARAGQPTAPAAPRFSADSPFTRPARPPKRPEPKPARTGEGRPDARGERRPEGRGDRPNRPTRTEGTSAGAPPRRRGKDEPIVEILAVPEIGVMKLKPAGKRHRGAGEKGRGRPGAPPETEAEKAARKKPRPSKVYGGAEEFRRPIKPVKRGRPTEAERSRRIAEAAPKVSGPIVITGPLTVGAFAEKIGVAPADIIKTAFLKGKPITINQLMDLDLAEELAIERDIDLQIRLERDETDIEAYRVEDREEDLAPRPPVVTIMGHVDHGKTTILDFYRRSQVVDGEFGGITQHIGAYQVKTARGEIVFLDTPGHEAFTAMRARGVQATDIVVLVVAADDGVMPQTVESINHARAAGVPIIVAVNKIDLPQARPERVRTELMQHQILSTALGGETEFVEISAKKGLNMDALLEIILLQAEMLELKANPTRPAEAIVIESHIDSLRGAVATVLVERGTLKVGQYFVVGQQYGRVRAMLDDHGRAIEQSSPAQPVELIGLTGTPEVGELLLVMEDERKAREIAERRLDRRRAKDLTSNRPITLEGIAGLIAEGKVKELNVILKADVQGSLEAISQSLEKLSSDAVRVRMLHTGTGSVTENDVNLALASSAIIIGFNVRPEPGATDLAARVNVDIKSYRIIYELLEDVEKALIGMLDKRYSEQITGRVEVREIFRVTKVGAIAGCMVLTGEIQRNSKARLVRDGKVVYDGKIDSLRRHKDDVSKVAAGYECGLMLERFQDVKQGDIVETYTMTEIPAELTRTQS